MAEANHQSGKGLTILLTTLAAAGAYYFWRDRVTPRHKRRLRGWMLRLKGELMENLEEAKDLSREKYQALVDKLAEKYQGLKNVDSEDLADYAHYLKTRWRR